MKTRHFTLRVELPDDYAELIYLVKASEVLATLQRELFPDVQELQGPLLTYDSGY